MVIDLDPQASSAEWKDSREGDTPVVVPIPSTRLPQALQAAREGSADLVLIAIPRPIPAMSPWRLPRLPTWEAVPLASPYLTGIILIAFLPAKRQNDKQAMQQEDMRWPNDRALQKECAKWQPPTRHQAMHHRQRPHASQSRLSSVRPVPLAIMPRHAPGKRK